MKTTLSSIKTISSRYKHIFFVAFSLLILVPVLSLNYRDLRFQPDRLFIINQLGEQYGHHGVLEMYVHLYAGMFLFIASIISIFILYGQFKSSTFTWRTVLAGIFVTGMIGLSESIDHLFAVYVSHGFFALAGHNFFHFIHVLGGPLAIFFFYRGTKEYSMQFKEGGKPLSKTAILLLLSILPISTIAVTFLTLRVIVLDIETKTVFAISVPALVLAGFTLKESYEQWKMQSFLMGFLSMLAVSVTLLYLAILSSLNTAVLGNAYFYVLSYSLQDIFHVVTAAVLILFTISMNILLNEN